MNEYNIIRIIGRGSFGAIHLAERRTDMKHVTMKKVPTDALTEEELESTKNEVRVLQMLQHPNIIEYYDSFVEEEALCIIMEYAAGGTLQDYLKGRNGSLLSQKEVLHFFSQIVLGLEHIHFRKVLHRDLKTTNVLLTARHDIIKIGDFGISKILSSKSNTSTVVGTPCYLSPELCENKPYNEKSDIWALGCILYELMSLRRAFQATTLGGLVRKIIHGLYDPIEETHCDQSVIQLLQMLLSLKPSQRPYISQVMAHPCLIEPLYSLYFNLGAILTKDEGNIVESD